MDNHIISNAVKILAVFAIPAYLINKNAKAAAIKIDKIFKTFLNLQPEISEIKPDQRVEFLDNDFFKKWTNDVRAMGCDFICEKLETYKNIKAIHSIWWEPKNKFFVFSITNNANEKLNAKFCISKTTQGIVYTLFGGKGSMMSIPGIYRREYCDRDIDTREMIEIYASKLSSFGGSSISHGSSDSYDLIRKDLNEIKREFKSRTNGIVPIEVLAGYNAKVPKLMIKLIHYHIRNLNHV